MIIIPVVVAMVLYQGISFTIKKEKAIPFLYEIIYILADGCYCDVYFMNRKLETKTCCLIYFLCKLNSDVFFRTSRSAVVNMCYVKYYHRISYRKLDLYMIDDQKITVSESRIPGFMALLPSYQDITIYVPIL